MTAADDREINQGWSFSQMAVRAVSNEPSAYYSSLISEMYDQSWYGTLAEAELAYYQELTTGRKTLEFPVGTGRLTIPLLESGVDIYGFDNSAEMLETLQRKLAVRHRSADAHRFIHWGALNTPYPCAARRFEVAVIAFASFSLMHSNMQSMVAENRIFRELNRVLCLGGITVINDYRLGKIDFETLAHGKVFNHDHVHPEHGEILEEQVSHFSVESNEIVPRQVIRHRTNRLIRKSDHAVLRTCSEITPIWDTETFPLLGADAGFEYIRGTPVHFHSDTTINHVFRKYRET